MSVRPANAIDFWRGFALVTTPSGEVVRRAGGVSAGDALRLQFADGAVDAVAGGGGDVGGKKKPRPAAGQGSLF